MVDCQMIEAGRFDTGQDLIGIGLEFAYASASKETRLPGRGRATVPPVVTRPQVRTVSSFITLATPGADQAVC